MSDDVDFFAGMQPVLNQLQVQFAHPVHDHLFGLIFAMNDERGVFFLDLVQRPGDLGLVRLGLRLDRQADHRCREGDRWQLDTRITIGQRVAGLEIVDLHDGHDVPRPCVGNRFGMSSLHLQQLGDLDGPSGPAVLHRLILVQRSAEHPQKAHLRDEGVDAGLEDLRDQRTVRFRIDPERVSLAGRGTLQVRRGGCIACKTVEKFLHADVRFGTRAEDGNQRPCDNRLRDRTGQFLAGQFFPFEVPLHQIFVSFDSRVDHLLTGCRRIHDDAGRDVAWHVDGADNTAEVVPEPDRHVHPGRTPVRTFRGAIRPGRRNQCSRRRGD